AQLYDYMQRRLLEANMKQADAPLSEVLGLLSTLSEAWIEVSGRVAPMATESRVTQAAAEAFPLEPVEASPWSPPAATRTWDAPPIEGSWVPPAIESAWALSGDNRWAAPGLFE